MNREQIYLLLQCTLWMLDGVDPSLIYKDFKPYIPNASKLADYLKKLEVSP